LGRVFSGFGPLEFAKEVVEEEQGEEEEEERRQRKLAISG